MAPADFQATHFDAIMRGTHSTCLLTMSLTIYTHADCLAHDPGTGHPENPMRLQGILRALDDSPLKSVITFAEAPLGTDAQVLLAHSPALLKQVKDAAPDSGTVSLDPDTHMSPGSLAAALRAVGATCQGVDDLMAGNGGPVFCATRPPGHHATPDHAMGFCLFNQVAIAAIHGREHHALDRVAIVDFDVHHGNGSQDIALGRDGIFYISTHQSPLYPGTGSTAENRDNNVLNVPLHGGTGHRTYLAAFTEQVLPALEAWQPQLLLVSAGFDAHQGDPLAGMALTDETYRWLGEQLKGVADRYCEGRLLSSLEGGYNLDVLPGSVLAYLEGILAP